MDHNENGFARQRNRFGITLFKVVLPIVLAKYALYCYLTYIYEDRNFYPDLKFDSKNIHPSLYISKNNTVISNGRHTFFTRKESIGPSNLKRYMGVTLNSSMSMNKNMYFEVKTLYKPVLSTVKGMLFEIGFEHLKDLDTSIHLRSTPRTIYIRVEICINDDKSICLIGHDGLHKYESHKLSMLEEHKTFDILFGFHIKPDADLIEVTFNFYNNKKPTRQFCKFKEAGLHSKLWPVFGMSDPSKFKINMKLVNSTDLVFDTSRIHPMIYISDDNREIANVDKKRTAKVAGHKGKRYKLTVIGDTSFDIENTKFKKWPKMAHFRVLLEYTVMRPIAANETLFSIGLGRWPPRYIDNYWYTVPSIFSVSVIGETCENEKKVCLFSQKNGLKILRGMAMLSSSQVGSYFKGIITFSTDFNDRAITVQSDYSRVVFDNVDFSKTLMPYFSLDRCDIDAKMTLNESFVRPWYDRLYYKLKSFQYAFQRM